MSLRYDPDTVPGEAAPGVCTETWHAKPYGPTCPGCDMTVAQRDWKPVEAAPVTCDHPWHWRSDWQELPPDACPECCMALAQRVWGKPDIAPTTTTIYPDPQDEIDVISVKKEPELRHVLAHLYYAIEHLARREPRTMAAWHELKSIEGLVFFDGDDEDYENWLQTHCVGGQKNEAQLQGQEELQGSEDPIRLR